MITRNCKRILAGVVMAGIGLSASLCLAALPLQEMSDEELSQTVGQALITVEKSYGNQQNNDTGNVVGGYPACSLASGKCGSQGMSFTRIVLDVDAYVNANIDMLELGNYGAGVSSCHSAAFWVCSNATSYSDIRANTVNLGTTNDSSNGDGNSGKMTDLHLQEPYIEVAYDGDDGVSGNTGQKKVVGLRIGAKSVDGVVGGNFMTLSGDFSGNVCVGALCVQADLHGHRQTGICALGNSTCLNTQALGYLPLGEGTSPANNLYLSIENRDLWWPRFGTGPQGVARAGYWINLQDGLKASLGSLNRIQNCWSATYC